MPTESNTPSALLKTRTIYDVLDGDAKFHSNELDEDVNLPYQSGPMLVETLNRFGLPSAYGSSSRWMYVERLVGHCLETQQIPKMFAFFFDLRRFHKDLQGLATEEIKRKHKAIVAAAIDAINDELLFGGHELRRLGNTYSVVSIDHSPAMETPSIERIDCQYVKDVAERAQRDVAQGNTTARLPKRERFSKRCSAKPLSVKVRSRLRTATSTSCSIRRRTCTTFMPTVAYATSSMA